MIYFAYCTLLDVESMRNYCPTAEPLGIARLPGHRVSFATYSTDSRQGGCNLDKAAGQETWGVLYEVTPEELEALDRAAGLDKGYYEQVDVVVIDKDDEPVPALTYVIPEPGGPFHPSSDYTRPILVGARALQLPQAYVAELEKIIAAAQ
jgi:cation transport regulator ChaC